ETLDAVLEQVRKQPGFGDTPPQAETVLLGNQKVQRMVLRAPALGREVHFYEGYWAPLTEGAVSLRDVIWFLVRAGLNGIYNRNSTFNRWAFDKWLAFPIPVRTWAYLVVALLTVAALVCMNAIVGLVVTARVALSATPTWLSDALFYDLTTTLNIF